VKNSGRMCMAEVEWALKGELVLSCNCTVFCPCVLSLGQHPPNRRLLPDLGRFPDRQWLSWRHRSCQGLNLGLIMEIPGLYEPWQLDCRPFCRQAGLDLCDKGIHQDISPARLVARRRFCRSWSVIFWACSNSRSATRSRATSGSSRFPKIIDGVVAPIPGKNHGEDTVISNSEYWIAPEIIVAKSERSKLAGLSAATGTSPGDRLKSASARLERPKLNQAVCRRTETHLATFQGGHWRHETTVQVPPRAVCGDTGVFGSHPDCERVVHGVSGACGGGRGAVLSIYGGGSAWPC
jgi:hypothetical protein